MYTQAKQMISSSLLNHFCPVMSYRTSSKEKESDAIIVHGSVTRYGPRTSCQAQGVNTVATILEIAPASARNSFFQF